MKKLYVGSRDSRLALIQTELLIQEFRKQYPQYEWVVRPMKTSGDLLSDKPLDKLGGKGLFVKELDRALLNGEIDLAVHSLKDLPMDLEEHLQIGAYSLREDPRDALVLPQGRVEPDTGKPIGCSSQRRRLQVAHVYPDWPVAPIRGNVLTRLDKLDQGAYGALVLAVAGLKRLGLEQRIHRVFTVSEILPAAGQGTLAVVIRDGTDDPAYGLIQELVQAITNPESRICAEAERSFVKTLNGGCSAPIAAYAVLEGDALHLTGLYCPDEPVQGSGEKILRDRITGVKTEGKHLGARLALRLLAQHAAQTSTEGKVWLLGAGPGDPGLLTVKAQKVLQTAEVVLYDRLVGKGILAQIPAQAERIYVGKKPGEHLMVQAEINRLIARNAAQGKQVVRLKGGDPFLFGRGGEELEGLKEAGIPFEVVPGVSSALGVPAYFGIPVTHRDYGSAVHIITGHSRSGKEPRTIPYRALVQAGGTFIFLMGFTALEAICTGLIHAGLDPDTPGAILEQGTTAKQRKVLSYVSRLSVEAYQAGIKAPAVVVIGEVCGLASWFSWIEAKPLAGLRIGVSRPPRKESRLSELLAAAGAEVVPIPAIQTVPIEETPRLEQALSALSSRDWLAFTSPEGVEVFFAKLQAYQRDIRSLGGIRFAAIGGATTAALANRGILVNLVPDHFNGRSLGIALAQAVQSDERVILPRSRIGTAEILKPLQGAGIEVLDIPIYDTLPAAGYLDPWYRELLLEGLDWLTLTSTSTVEGFRAIAGVERMRGIKALCIGSQTAAAAARYGMETVVADTASMESMVEKLIHTLGHRVKQEP
ncbi:MAG: uroporphyrinogen-III C-methyltransferase [Treponema sp.]|jgi:uroporphyrinogen III methyltransferase/synthase|nr:uroporphyrinogen-III C-methyltransferase [Treponema sp.]